MIAEALDEGPGGGRAKAVGRTRVRRGQVQARLGTGLNPAAALLTGEDGENEAKRKREDATGQEGDAEVFDDTDFYQEMLRDVIHAKTGAGAGSASYSFFYY